MEPEEQKKENDDKIVSMMMKQDKMRKRGETRVELHLQSAYDHLGLVLSDCEFRSCFNP